CPERHRDRAAPRRYRDRTGARCWFPSSRRRAFRPGRWPSASRHEFLRCPGPPGWWSAPYPGRSAGWGPRLGSGGLRGDVQLSAVPQQPLDMVEVRRVRPIDDDPQWRPRPAIESIDAAGIVVADIKVIVRAAEGEGASAASQAAGVRLYK